MSDEKLKVPKDPIERAFWEGWWASAQSHCNRYHGLSWKTQKQAWKKSMAKAEIC